MFFSVWAFFVLILEYFYRAAAALLSAPATAARSILRFSPQSYAQEA
jgi:hypothetical protein